MATLFGSLGIFELLFAILLLVLWTLLPFAVFGIKDRLDAQTKLLQGILAELKRLNDSATKSEKTGRTDQTTRTLSKNQQAQTEQETDGQEPEVQVSINDMYADPATKWFKKKVD
ncbi:MULTISPECIES: hypothetical protein [Methylomonas]|uniref:Uncharacterized protein n=1 Tax=Methylomonas koyamae TaxID=702114 RepID=A0A177PDV4_9GAMM|nr:hypothetical protein [Methylomonas koyamae]OAI28475.1 hypothetical protein A1355_17415 [Methylomonas koyamae]